MTVLFAVVGVVGVLCVLDLILTLGVIKRLREHTELLSNQAGTGNRGTALAPGEEIGEFRTSTVEGESFSNEQLVGEVLVGFFTPTCRPCKEKVGKFAEYARTRGGGQEQVLAVVVGGAEEAEPMVSELRAVSRVVVERQGGPLLTAFQIDAFPVVLTVAPDHNGRPVVSDDRVDLERAAIAV